MSDDGARRAAATRSGSRREEQELEQERRGRPAAATTRRASRPGWRLLQRAGGAVMPIVTTIFAFVMAMLVIAATGHNPFKAFKGIFDGTGLNWLFPWVLGRRAATPRSTSSRR